jgi:hypothetical protein
MDWSNAGYAGAFILGAIAATAAVIRLTRIVLEHARREPPHGP